jgi:pyruvate dehydrogenase E2 component (dihydrolipoamide acetyltransferase)
MKIDVTMPKLGESLTEGTVLKWWKKPGESVKKDEVLLEVSTDKVDSEIPSPEDGVLVEIVAQEQETVEVGAVLARLETEKSAVKPEPASTPEQKKSSVKEQAVRPKAAPEAESRPVPPTGSGIVDVVMPKMGESLTEGTILKWLKTPGERIRKDENLLEISTDKVDSEIPSPVDGVIKEILFKENETVEVGQVIARVEISQESVETDTREATAEKPPTEERKEPAESAETPRPLFQSKEDRRTKPDGRFYSPLVRTIARRENVSLDELESIAGTGLHNRVTKKDILGFLEQRTTAPGTGKETASAIPRGERGRVETIPMDNIRKKMAEHMRRSLDTSAHVYSVSECDMTRLLNIMKERREQFLGEEGFKLTVTPFVLYGVVKALQDFPRVNSSLEGDNILEKKDINLGIAVATSRGLIVPVIKNAEEKSLTGLARATNDLVIRARDNKLTYEDIEGSTFSVTNYGIFGNIIGLPIINQPNVAILGLGAIKKRPVVIEKPEGDFIAIRSMAYISMSYDHRLVDGELGGRFMQRLVEYLEGMETSVF